MTPLIQILKTLSQGDEQLFREVASEIKELLIDEEEGSWRVNTQSALRFAFELERSALQEELPSRVQTRNALMQGASNKQLINQLFASTRV